jgi:hypothetical protein
MSATGGTIHALPDDAVVEVPTVVDANGVHPLVTSQPDLHQVGLMSTVKDVERHVIRAAMTGQRAEAVTGLALHPLVDSVNVAKTLVDGYVEQVPGNREGAGAVGTRPSSNQMTLVRRGEFPDRSCGYSRSRVSESGPEPTGFE